MPNSFSYSTHLSTISLPNNALSYLFVNIMFSYKCLRTELWSTYYDLTKSYKLKQRISQGSCKACQGSEPDKQNLSEHQHRLNLSQLWLAYKCLPLKVFSMKIFNQTFLLILIGSRRDPDQVSEEVFASVQFSCK